MRGIGGKTKLIMEREKQDFAGELALRVHGHINNINWTLNYRRASSAQKTEMIRKKGFWEGLSLISENKKYSNRDLLEIKGGLNIVIAELLTEVDINQIL